MDEDETEELPQFEVNLEVLEYMNAKFMESPHYAEFMEYAEEFGLESDTPPSVIHWPKLTRRIHDHALSWKRDRTRPLVEIGRFGVIEVIGEGGFGTVYKALDPEMDRYVAIKLCPVRKQGSEGELKLEAKALARLKHANIITIHDVGFGSFEDGEAFYIVTEFVEAVSMRDYSPVPGGQHPREELIDIFSSVGEALLAAHEAGVVHGDIKPGNIIFNENTRQPYIIDFGLAQIVDADVETIERTRGGTLPYMAPEQLRGGGRTKRTDQYAFCAALWRCLDGRCPFLGHSTAKILAYRELGPPVVRRSAFISEPVRDVLRVGLREDPAERFADMRALLDALALARGPRLVEEVVLEPSVSGDEPSMVKPAPKLTLIKGLVVGFALLSSLSALVILVRDEAPQPMSEIQIDRVTKARLEFARAARALDAGQDWVGYKAWDNARPILMAKHPEEAGRLTLELAEKMAQVQPKQVMSAWMATKGAEAYEQAALTKGTRPAKKKKMWEKAAEARGQAVGFFTDAGNESAAEQEKRCKERNDAGQSCGKLPSNGR